MLPWLKTGDNVLTHPNFNASAKVAKANAHTRFTIWGFVSVCASVSAGAMTDGYLDADTLELIGRKHWKLYTAQAVEAGLLTKTTRKGETVWRIIDDPNLLHIRQRDEVEWERARKRDASNPALTVPVRVRDGSACRYCGRPVNFGARTGDRRGTYDHREPGAPATVDTFVVACFGCNASRRDNRENWDDTHPLLPPPQEPLHTESDLTWYRKHPELVPETHWHLLGPAAQKALQQQKAAAKAPAAPDGLLAGTGQEPDQIPVSGRDRVGAPEHHTPPRAGYGSGAGPGRGGAGADPEGGGTDAS